MASVGFASAGAAVFLCSWQPTHDGLLARLKRRPAPHRLHGVPLFVEGLEVDRRARGHLERGRAVVVDFGVAQHGLHVPRAVVDRRRQADEGAAGRPAVAVAADVCHAVVQGHDAELLDRAARHARQPGPA